ncbi:MAG: UDP-N-acetylenolpyruvoylglucosamine reductase [Elusimicrobia bacterium RIFOXYA12_FULL_51_18]|nr:MAG: UDP-N-acetylenolpyruvoylglucosamine reductase [Elusimicrobia bacterium RIFOXYA12_FULL_51_18]OGS30365.1 MAG: UDP-N-acetylenolpyruvoylglucosamine reductase [Elusimicrobia bacterium RIFOXYA2_FULL_53_38]
MIELYRPIKERFGADCLFDRPASDFTTYRAGGPMDVVVKPASREDLAWLTAFCLNNAIAYLTLGAGSNILVSDKGLKGVCALTLKLDKIVIAGGALTAEAGALWDNVVKAAVEAGLAGLEKTSGIPGTVGGAVFMNAGAFGQETFDCIESLEVMNRSGSALVLKKSDVSYAYRKVEGLEGLTILSAVFRLPAGDGKALAADRACVLGKRAEKQPLDLPSAGSVFKRPSGDFASRLIDEAGLKGLRVGDARVSEKHAGFIVNGGKATASDIYGLIKKVRAEVKAKTGVVLELEQILLGEFE